MKSTLNSSAYRILATAAIVFATFVAVFFMFNASLSSAGASFFNAAEASTSDAGGFNLDHSWGGGSIGFPYGSFVYGCTDDAATNYDPDADINDRSCIFPPVEGCTDPFATNYDFKADKDDDSCEYPEVEVTSCDLTASAEIIATGGSVTLTWETEGYEEFTLNGQSISDANGNKTFTNVLEDTTYTFVATNSNGDRCQATVTVQCLPPVVPTCESFNITQSTVVPNANLTFNWNTTNATNVSIDNGIGAVTVDGTNEIFQAPAAEGTYTYTLTFDGKTNNSCVDTVKVEKPVVQTPRCDAFNASPVAITEGESSLLTWETTNATRVVINNGIGEVAADSSIEVSPLTSTTYLLTVFGTDNKKVQCEAPVTVTPKVVPPTCDSFTASPDMIITGGTSTLAWETTNAVSVSINNTVGTVGLDGNTEVALVTGTVFVLTATGEDGTEVTCEAPVQVSAEPVPVCEAFDATPGTLPVNGGSVDLAWTVTGAETVTIDNGVGAVALTGNQSVNVTESTTFTLTAVDSNGDDVSCLAPVAVADPAPVFTCAENVSFIASDTSIDEGDSSRLSWDVTGADSVSISEINASGLTGTEDVSPSSDTTYVLTATKSGFNPIDCNVRIDVSSGGGGGGGGGSSSPRCELEISDNRIDRGDEITLTWDSSRARELILTDDRGNTIVTTEDRLSDDKEELFDGEITLTPTRDTEYTLRVERGSRDRECTVDVEVEDDEIVLLETRDQAPLVAGISLTEVPYTGFEAGTVMTFLFYALLAAWALYITYVLVIPKTLLSAAPQLVTPQNSADHMTSAESMRPDVFAALSTASVATSTAAKAAAPANLPVAPVATAEPVAAVEEETVVDTATVVENQAHLHQALLSSSAVQSLIAMTTDADRSETLTKVIADAKGAYPLEDGWVVINQTRLTELTTQPAATPTPTPTVTALTGNGSLAEAVVTGNVVAAYELIGTRPMFALADASADLDTLYRNRKGANEPVSDFLTAATKDMTDVQIADMIAALTGALDGTYTDEASAVKMAIMKAVKIAA